MSRSDAFHGGPVWEELQQLGLDYADILDVSVNLNPYGPSERVRRAIATADIVNYPEATAMAARTGLAKSLDCHPDELILGNGAADLLWTIASVYSRDQSTLMVDPTFSEYGRAVESRGGSLVRIRASADDGFVVPLDAVRDALRTRRASSVYLCSPNNPTGIVVPIDAIKQLARDHEDVVFVVDQAFLSLSAAWQELSESPVTNMIYVRSMTKDHAIAGVRIGYAWASSTVIRNLERHRPPWSTSASAQAAVMAASAESGFLAESRRRIDADRSRLIAALRQLGLAPVTSSAPYVMVRVGDAADIRHRLLVGHRVMVRDCASFGEPAYIRIAVRPRSSCERVLTGLAEVLEEPSQ